MREKQRLHWNLSQLAVLWICNKVRWLLSIHPLPFGFLTLVLVFRIPINWQSWRKMSDSKLLPWSEWRDKGQPQMFATHVSAVWSGIGYTSNHFVKLSVTVLIDNERTIRYCPVILDEEDSAENKTRILLVWDERKAKAPCQVLFWYTSYKDHTWDIQGNLHRNTDILQERDILIYHQHCHACCQVDVG
jgi:hypothetical protein